MVKFSLSQRPENWRRRWSQPKDRGRWDELSLLTQWCRKRGWGQILPSFTFCSTQTLNRVDDAHTHWGVQSAEPAGSNLTPSGNALPDTPPGMFNLGIPRPVKLTHEMDHHKWDTEAVTSEGQSPPVPSDFWSNPWKLSEENSMKSSDTLKFNRFPDRLKNILSPKIPTL